MAFEAGRLGRRPACKRRPHTFERRQLRAAARARREMLPEGGTLGDVGIASIAIEIRHDRLLAIAGISTKDLSHHRSSAGSAGPGWPGLIRPGLLSRADLIKVRRSATGRVL